MKHFLRWFFRRTPCSFKLIWVWMILAPFLPGNVLALTAEEQGLSIAMEEDRRDGGFSDYSVRVVMKLKNRYGEESTRYLRMQILEVAGDGDRILAIFDHPADVKGTALLTYTHKTGSDDQWIYLPALKRVKRISSANKSGPFMGSEFAFEDLGSQEVEKYTYRYLRDEIIEGIAYFVFERYPVDEYSGYTRQVVWMDREEYRPWKIDYYDRKNTLLKTLTYHDYGKYLDRYWRTNKMFMLNHQTGKSTLLTWSDFNFRTGLTLRDFDHKSLKRVR